MNEPETPLVSSFNPTVASVKSYTYGFIGCLVITLAAYMLATSQWFSPRADMVIIASLAIIQCTVQLRQFLHVGHELRPRYKLAVLMLMLCIVLILVVGSLWIMHNLNYRMMLSPVEQNKYLQVQDGL